METDHSGYRRAATLIATGMIVEVALRLLVYRAPAFRLLVAPLYWIVGTLFVLAVAHALRSRRGHDRRHTDRRHPPAA